MSYQTRISQELFAEAQHYHTGGVGSGTRSSRAGWQPCPVFVERGEGSHLLDVDGNEYVDYAMGLGPLILGHRPAPVIEAVVRTIQERGSIFALAHDLETQAAAKICECVPSIESLRFGNSGTEVVNYAIRLARAYTGKEKVIRFEGHYHGWSDLIHWSNRPPLAAAGRRQHPVPLPSSTGIPHCLADTLIVLPWNDVDLLERAIERYRHEIAAVITEPILGNVGGIMPQEGYLQAMRELTAANGVLLIFDEVLTGFRVALGGTQEMVGIMPDLTTLAKAMGGGFSAAVFGGKREIMDLIANGETMHGGTYNSNPIVTSAVLATLNEVSEPGFYERLNSLGEKLAKGIVDIVRRSGLPAMWTGVGAMFQVWFTEDLPRDYREAVPLMEQSPFHTLWRELMARGVLVQPKQDGLWLLSGAHTQADVEQTLQAVEDAMPAVVSAWKGR